MNAFELEQYQAEVKEKWGQTAAYQQHAEKTKHYSQQNWGDLAAGMDRIMAEFAQCMQNHHTPDSAEAQQLVIRLQSHITQHYYDCTKEILAGLGQMYVADERFRNNIDKHRSGTAAFICDAIGIYCRK